MKKQNANHLTASKKSHYIIDASDASPSLVTTPPARSENLEAPKQKKHHFYLEAKVLSGDCKQRAEYATP